MDTTGGAVPAVVTLMHNDTGATVSTVSDASGEFGFEFLRLGICTLRLTITYKAPTFLLSG